jgi:hypothetical protein
VSATDGTDAHLYAAIKRAMVAGSVVVGQGHSIRAADIPAAEEAAEP